MHPTNDLATLLAEQQRLAQRESRARRVLEGIDPCWQPPGDLAAYSAALAKWREVLMQLAAVNGEIGRHYLRRLEN